MITLDPGGKYTEEEPHEGEEFGYVLSGTITLHLGDKSYKVKKMRASILNLDQIIT